MLKLTALLFLTLGLTNCGQGNSRFGNGEGLADAQYHTSDKVISASPDTTKPENQKSVNRYYPFELQETGGQYQIMAGISGKELYPRYYDFFQKHGYEGNGYCWEGHIRQILEKLDKTLLNNIDFDPEGGAFFARANSRESQLRFVELLSPIFSDLKKLEEWVKKADRSRIDD